MLRTVYILPKNSKKEVWDYEEGGLYFNRLYLDGFSR